MPKFREFKDLSVTFDKHIQTGDLIVTKNERAIKTAIQNLVVTRRGERFFNSDIGTGLTNLLFEAMDYGIAGSIQSEVSQIIQKYEPRVDLVSVNAFPNFDDNRYEIEVEFRIKGIDIVPTTVEIFLERTR